MGRLKMLIVFLVCFMSLYVLVGCKTGTQANNAMMIGKIQGNNADEEAIYNILAELKDYISTSQWDKWLALYSNDAILTYADKKVSKMEMRKKVQGITYVISEMEILKKKIGKSEASVSVRMIGNSKKHLETYKLKKYNGNWLIVEETNP